MRATEIIAILKGDLPGHKFRGNQWLDGEGNFDPHGRGGRNRQPVAVPKVRPVRAPAPKPTPKPTPPKQPTPSQIKAGIADFGKGAVALKTSEIAKTVGEVKSIGGAMNEGWQQVEMKDGSVAGIKTIADGTKCGWDKMMTPEYQAQSEILASKVAEALGSPVRCVEPVDGHPDQVVCPWLEGMSGILSKYGDGKTEATSLNPENAQRWDALNFYHQVVGNYDGIRPSGDFNNGNLFFDAQSNKLLGIDDALSFLPESLTATGAYADRNPGIPDFSLLGNVSAEQGNNMAKSLMALQPTFASMGRLDNYNAMMGRFSAGWVNYGMGK